MINFFFSFFFQQDRQKAQAIQAHNKTPHILSRDGYKKLVETIMKEKEKTRSESSDPTCTEPPSPPSRHQKWLLARKKKSGEYTSAETQELAEKIVSNI